MKFVTTPSRIGAATVKVPGDKSISHRALLLGSIAEGDSHVRGFLAGEDCLATLAAMQAMGVSIQRHSDTELTIEGVGMHGLAAPASELDLGNSGTAMRLMAGLLCGQKYDSTLAGDESLSRRPMDRIVEPLTKMGAAIEGDCDGTPPLQIAGGVALRGIDYDLPVASAQVKSAVLLAGLYASGATTIREPAVTRDHTERMLQTMGADLVAGNRQVTLTPGKPLRGCELSVPGDLSSAAFVMLAAIVSDAANLLIENVGVNPTRAGVITILRAMGADIVLENERHAGAEPVADIRIRSSRLRGITVDPALVPLAIDEFPLLFVAAAAAQGETRFSGLAELRVKESDRIAAMVAGLRRLGIDVDEHPDGAVIWGGRISTGEVDSCGDHRIAMSFAVAGMLADGAVTITDVANVETSFPGFVETMAGIGVTISVASATDTHSRAAAESEVPIIAIDGPERIGQGYRGASGRR